MTTSGNVSPTCQCWNCGRAVRRVSGTSDGVGVVCDRAECQKVKAALSPRFKMFWFRAQLPGPDAPGRAGSFTLDGKPNWPSGIAESSLQTNIDSKRRAQEVTA